MRCNHRIVVISVCGGDVVEIFGIDRIAVIMAVGKQVKHVSDTECGVVVIVTKGTSAGW